VLLSGDVGCDVGDGGGLGGRADVGGGDVSAELCERPVMGQRELGERRGEADPREGPLVRGGLSRDRDTALAAASRCTV
jgi:hypothetical protein